MFESVTVDAVIAPPTVRAPFKDVFPDTDRLPDTAPEAVVRAPPTVRAPFKDVLPDTDKLPDTAAEAVVRAPPTAKGPPIVADPEMVAEAAVRELVTTKPPLVVTVLVAYPPKETFPIPSKVSGFTEVFTKKECPRALLVMYFIPCVGSIAIRPFTPMLEMVAAVRYRFATLPFPSW